MFFIRILVILISFTILIFSANESFAASGSGVTASGNTTVKVKNTERIDTDTSDTENSNSEEKKIEDKKKEQIIWKLTVETFKLQGNKILKDIDVSIERVYPDPKIRIEVYTSIQKTLEFRKQKLEKSEFSPEAKYIFKTYLEYMVAAIEKKKKNLE